MEQDYLWKWNNGESGNKRIVKLEPCPRPRILTSTSTSLNELDRNFNNCRQLTSHSLNTCIHNNYCNCKQAFPVLVPLPLTRTRNIEIEIKEEIFTPLFVKSEYVSQLDDLSEELQLQIGHQRQILDKMSVTSSPGSVSLNDETLTVPVSPSLILSSGSGSEYQQEQPLNVNQEQHPSPSSFTFTDSDGHPLTPEDLTYFSHLRVVYATAIVAANSTPKLLENGGAGPSKSLLLFSEVGALTPPNELGKTKLVTIRSRPNQLLSAGQHQVLKLSMPPAEQVFDVSSAEACQFLTQPPTLIPLQDSDPKTSLIPIHMQHDTGRQFTAKATFAPFAFPFTSSDPKFSCQVVTNLNDTVVCQQLLPTSSTANAISTSDSENNAELKQVKREKSSNEIQSETILTWPTFSTTTTSNVTSNGIPNNDVEQCGSSSRLTYLGRKKILLGLDKEQKSKSNREIVEVRLNPTKRKSRSSRKAATSSEKELIKQRKSRVSVSKRSTKNQNEKKTLLPKGKTLNQKNGSSSSSACLVDVDVPFEPEFKSRNRKSSRSLSSSGAKAIKVPKKEVKKIRSNKRKNITGEYDSNNCKRTPLSKATDNLRRQTTAIKLDEEVQCEKEKRVSRKMSKRRSSNKVQDVGTKREEQRNSTQKTSKRNKSSSKVKLDDTKLNNDTSKYKSRSNSRHLKHEHPNVRNRTKSDSESLVSSTSSKRVLRADSKTGIKASKKSIQIKTKVSKESVTKMPRLPKNKMKTVADLDNSDSREKNRELEVITQNPVTGEDTRIRSSSSVVKRSKSKIPVGVHSNSPSTWSVSPNTVAATATLVEPQNEKEIQSNSSISESTDASQDSLRTESKTNVTVMIPTTTPPEASVTTCEIDEKENHLSKRKQADFDLEMEKEESPPANLNVSSNAIKMDEEMEMDLARSKMCNLNLANAGLLVLADVATMSYRQQFGPNHPAIVSGAQAKAKQTIKVVRKETDANPNGGEQRDRSNSESRPSSTSSPPSSHLSFTKQPKRMKLTDHDPYRHLSQNRMHQ